MQIFVTRVVIILVLGIMGGLIWLLGSAFDVVLIEAVGLVIAIPILAMIVFPELLIRLLFTSQRKAADDKARPHK